ncbi:MAG: S-layer homology domain-containing protein [Clostridia bacterium]|nr:S-layer homology domain-containing protein [Clostridia bacterium]
MKKLFAIILVITMALTVAVFNPITANAQTDAAEKRSMQRLMDLGVFTATAPDKMDLTRVVTREELAVALILLTGKEDKVTLFKNSSLFSDVPATRASNGYVNAAVKLGYMSAMPDGKFHPAEKVTFAQTAKIIGKLLKYDDYNVTGSYPDNYLTLLKNLGILESISYSANNGVTRGQMAVMLDRMLETKTFGGSQKFIETLAFFKNLIILDNKTISPKADVRRLLTDSGAYYMAAGVKIPDAGKKYIARMKDGQVVKLALANMTFTELSIKSMTSGTAALNNGSKFSLPANPTYYYKGRPVDFDTVINAIKANSSVILGADKDGTQYGVLFDPVTSTPRVITSAMVGLPLESQYSGFLIDRAGKYVSPSQIEVNDVVYEVTDIWKKNCYVLVHSNTVSGKITAILPNKVSPKSLEVDGKSFALSEDFPVDKLNGSASIQVGETAKVLLGSDGKAIDLVMAGDSDNESYALVVNAYALNSNKSEDFGTKYDYVTLLHTDGSKKTYRANASMNQFRGRLVRYSIIQTGKEYDTVDLTQFDYADTKVYRINKEDRMLGDYYVAGDAAMFNIVDANSAGEVQASVIKWSDLSDGYLLEGKVRYLHTSGDFNDIDVLLFDNALNDGIKYGLVVEKNSGYSPATGTIETVSVLINGQVYTYTGSQVGVFINSPVKVRMINNTITGIEYAITPTASSKAIQAVDASRIRIGGSVYSYHKDLVIYKLQDDSNWVKLSSSELKKGEEQREVTVYLDKPLNYGGKVIMITVR